MKPAHPCRVCGRPLRSRASVAEGVGPVCAVREGQVVLELEGREDALCGVTGQAVEALGVGEAGRGRGALGGAEGQAFDYAGTPFAEWPWVVACRADAAARGVACELGCVGEVYGRCARCAGRAEKAARVKG